MKTYPKITDIDLIVCLYPFKGEDSNIKKIIKKIKNHILVKYSRFKIQYSRYNRTPIEEPEQYKSDRLDYFPHLELRFNRGL